MIDSLATYCHFYMDGFDIVARRKCKYIDAHVYNDFMSYYDSVKDRIEACYVGTSGIETCW